MPKTINDKQSLRSNDLKRLTINIKPLMGYCLVEPSSADTKTASGIILPESAQEKPAQGKVIACGDDMVMENGKSVKCPVKNGDRVVYKKWGGD